MKKKSVIILSVILLILIILGFFIYNYFNVPKSNISADSIPTVPINYSNFASSMSNNPIVLDIPSDSAIMLNFYNTNLGTINIEKSYVLSENGASEGKIGDAGLTFLMNSKYLTILTNKNFCGVVQEARNNRDLTIQTTLSKTELAWKYKKLYRYRDCFGF